MVDEEILKVESSKFLMWGRLRRHSWHPFEIKASDIVKGNNHRDESMDNGHLGDWSYDFFIINAIFLFVCFCN